MRNNPRLGQSRSSVRMIDQRWLILFVLFVARSSFGYQFQSVASSAALIEAELHVGYAAIGTLIGLYTIPGAFLSLPGGVLGARFGDRAVGAAGLVLMIGGGLLTCAGDTVLPLTAGRLISGAGAVLFSLILNKMIIDWFAGREIVFAMGTLLSSWPFGIALGLMVQGRIAESFGWRTGMAIAALFCLLALVLILVVYRPPPDTPARAGGGDTWWNPPDWLSLRSVLIAASAWGCLNVGLIIMFSFGQPSRRARHVHARRRRHHEHCAVDLHFFSSRRWVSPATQRQTTPAGEPILFGGGTRLAGFLSRRLAHPRLRRVRPCARPWPRRSYGHAIPRAAARTSHHRTRHIRHAEFGHHGDRPDDRRHARRCRALASGRTAPRCRNDGGMRAVDDFVRSDPAPFLVGLTTASKA
jgi:MFS family permease